jgi:hypothetical protein
VPQEDHSDQGCISEKESWHIEDMMDLKAHFFMQILNFLKSIQGNHV